MARVIQIKNEMLKILLIEDNPADARLIEELLKEAGRDGYHLEQAGRLSIGLEYLAGEKFDVVFLDLGLPDSKGLDTLKAVTKKAGRLPIIVVTGLDDETTAIAAMRNGAQDYLLKGRIDSRVLWRVLKYAIERKQAEEALINSEEKYRSVVENAGEAILIAQDGLIKFINRKTIEILGYSEEELISKPFIEFIHPDDRQFVGEQYTRRMKGEEVPLGYEFRFIDSDGKIKWVEFNAINTEWENGPATLNFIRDITPGKRAEEALIDSVEKYRKLFEDSMDAIFVTTAEGRFIDVNQSMCSLFGYAMDELLALPALSVYADPGNRKVFQEEIESKRGVRDFEVSFRKKDGTIIECLMTATIWRQADGKIGGYRGIIHDITERKQSEEKLLKSYESLKKNLNDAINTMVKMVEMKDPYTAGHQQKVADLATTIAREMNLDDIRIDQLRTAAIIHDIGKIYIPSDILSRPGKLTDIEFSLIKAHAQGGYDIVKGMDLPCNVAKAVLQHHERLDGSGYPNGLKSEDTLLEAKILAVADVVEAMASHRPYRPALGIAKALDEISKNRGKIYDPDVVDACLGLFNNGRFEFKAV